MFRSAARGPAAPPLDAPGREGPTPDRDSIAAALRLQLLATEDATDGRAAWHVAEGLAAALVHASEGGDRPVMPDELLGWGLAREESFHLASANVRGSALPTVTRQRPSGGAELILVSGPDRFVAAHALWLDDLVGRLPAAGALVAVPHHRAILAHRLERWDHAVEAVNLLLLMAAPAWADGPGPVSPALYWWRDGSFVNLAGAAAGDTVQIDPPEAFLDMLEALPRP